MEVHHHHHHENKGIKKIKEYLIEGFMIFIAVSMGFIAENIRESISRHEKEQVLIESFIQDLKADTAALNYNIKNNLRKNLLVDSLLDLSTKDLREEKNRYPFYQYFIKGTYMALFIPSDAAITQIKTDGGLNIINKKGVIDSILKYDAQNKQILRHNGVYTDEAESLWKSAYKLMEIRILKDTSYVNFFHGRTLTQKMPPPVVNNPEEQRIFFGCLTRISLLTQVNRNLMTAQKEKAERLISFLSKAYHVA